MSKKYFLLIGIIVILILVGIFVFLNNNSIKVSQINYFKYVYNSDSDINNISIDILNPVGNVVATINDKNDISKIINTIKNEVVAPISKDNVLLGKVYIFSIKNVITDKNVKINVTQGQISINNVNHYNTTKDLTNLLNDTYKKYI